MSEWNIILLYTNLNSDGVQKSTICEFNTTKGENGMFGERHVEGKMYAVILLDFFGLFEHELTELWTLQNDM